MSLSLRWRLTLGIAAAVIITVAAILVTLRFALGGVLEDDLDSDLESDADLVAARITLVGLDDEARLQEVAETYSVGGVASGFVVVIRDGDGEELAATPGLEGALTLTDEEMEAVLSGGTRVRTVEVAEGEEIRVRSSPITFGGEVTGVLQVGEDAELTSRSLDRLQAILIGEVIGGAVLALIIGFWLARSAVNPLSKVIDVAAEIEAMDLDRRIEAKGGPPELKRLADTFDAMLERLDNAFDQQRNFVLDVSHELRTPLTALRGNIDVLLMDEGLDAGSRVELERMSGEVARLIRMTANILYLAHAEAGRELDRRPVELDVLCLEVYRQTKDLRPEVNFRFGHEDQVSVVGDRDLLKQMILNLVDNGLKYTPAGGDVTLSLYGDGSLARIVVEDTGPGIEPEQLPHIFKRFHRGRPGGRGAGTGIGLAISSWVAQAHGGRITVASELGKGSAFTVILSTGLDGEKSG